MATVGETSILSTYFQDQVDTQGAYQFTLSADGNFTTMTVYTKDNAGRVFRLCIYDDNAGVPNNLLAETVEGTTVAGGWVAVSISGSPVYIPTQTIWLSLHRGSGAPLVRAAAEAAGGTSHVSNPDTYAGGAEDPWSGGSAGSRRCSVYATYTPTTTVGDHPRVLYPPPRSLVAPPAVIAAAIASQRLKIRVGR